MSGKGRKEKVSSGSSSLSTRSMAARVENLELNIQQGLKDLKEQLVNGQEIPKTPNEVNDILAKIETFERDALASIAAVKTDLGLLIQNFQDYTQEKSLNSIVINGLEEKEGSDVCREICMLFKNFMKLDVKKGDIDYYYWTGRKSAEKKSRPLVVTFVNRWRREEIFKSKKSLKGSNFTIHEFLINKNLALYKRTRDKVGIRSCWTWNGRIYASIQGNRRLIRNESDINSMADK